MKTRFGSLFVVLAALLPTGCKMCCPSYDYCSPTNPGASQSEWCGKERRGSIFSGYTGAGEQVVPGDSIMEAPEVPAAPADEQPTVAPEAPAIPPPPMKINSTGYSRNASNANSSARRGR